MPARTVMSSPAPGVSSAIRLINPEAVTLVATVIAPLEFTSVSSPSASDEVVEPVDRGQRRWALEALTRLTSPVPELLKARICHRDPDEVRVADAGRGLQREIVDGDLGARPRDAVDDAAGVQRERVVVTIGGNLLAHRQVTGHRRAADPQRGRRDAAELEV